MMMSNLATFAQKAIETKQFPQIYLTDIFGGSTKNIGMFLDDARG